MTARLDALARLALADAVSEPGLQAKATALVKLADAGDGSPVPADRLRVELQRVAETEAISARGLQGVLAALATLERLDAPNSVQWLSTTPDLPAGADYWPFCCAVAHWQQEAFRELDADHGSQGGRDRWRQVLEGAPPWKHPPESL